jgi:hypothetical protein
VAVKCSGLLLHLHFFFRFILKSIFCYTLKCSVHIEAFFCGSLKVRYVSLSSAPCLRFLLRNLQLINWRQWGIFFPRGLYIRELYFAAQQHYEVTYFMKFSQTWGKTHESWKQKIILPLDYCLHQHLSCSPTQQMGSFQGRMG